MKNPMDAISADDEFLQGIDGWRPFLSELGNSLGEALSEQTNSEVAVDLQFSGSRVLSQFG